MSDLGNREVFSKNLKYYMELRGKDRTDISKALKIPYTTITDWEKGNTYPRIDKIEMLAAYFGVQKSDLIERKQESDLATKADLEMLHKNPDLRILLSASKDLRKSDIDFLVSMARRMNGDGD